MIQHVIAFAFVLVAVASPAPARAESKPKLAVFKCELFDTSGSKDLKVQQEQAQRLNLVTQVIKDDIDRRGVYTIVDTSRANELDSPHARFAAEGLFRECPGCEAEVAAQLGADLSMGCLIQKVSNLILNINYYIRDAKTERLQAQYSAAIRGNTDQTWVRSALWLLKNRVFEDPAAKAERHQRMQGNWTP
ncbi:MAG: DUF3280 domain-containing protein [Alphaproteobacteria bacterium GM202ARS2]|nr:DUF3280 domain-containing protein [Alphaproteobacteria bacterium GM202ARS2]